MNRAHVFNADSARMDEVADKSVHLIVTSPPYAPPETMKQLLADSSAFNDFDSFARDLIQFAMGFRDVYRECQRVLMPAGVLIVQVRDVRLQDYLVAITDAHRRMIELSGFAMYTEYRWRSRFVSVRKESRYQRAKNTGKPRPVDTERFLVFFKRGDEESMVTRTAEDSEAAELLCQDTWLGEPGKMFRPHPHQAPIPMIAALIDTYSRPGDLVLDPFCGGGTTICIAADRCRYAIGYEIDPATYAKAVENIQRIVNDDC